DVSIEYADMERPTRSDLVVVRDIPCRAARDSQRIDYLRHQRRPFDDGDAVAFEACIRCGAELGEGASQKWRAFGKQAVASAQDRLCRTGQPQRRADARRYARFRSNVVVIHSDAVVDIPALRGLNPILRENRYINAVDVLDGRLAKIEPSRQRAVSSLDENGRARAGSVIV